MVQEKVHEMFLGVDLLMAPARPTIASKVTEPLDRPPTGPQPRSRGLQGLIPAGNLAGLPAISLPCGFADKMPIAISFVARPWYENELIAVGHQFQSQTSWHREHPAVT
jgi:aspartyl-tRNA(Asn)/glutamyl-tRNA(Gln) amidotransferase subunit A